jgi:hypothetical protein
MRRAVAFSALAGLLLLAFLVSLIHARSEGDPGAWVEPLAIRSRLALAPWPVVGSPVHREAARADLAITQAASHALTWWTVDGGGWTFSRGGGYTLGGTIGQPDAGLLRGGGYALAGGFWPGGETVPVDHRSYLPLVVRRS